MIIAEKFEIPAQSKNEIRLAAKKHRKATDAQYTDCISRKIAANIISLPEFKNADAVFCYAPLKEEIKTWDIVSEALLQNKKLAFPKCLETEGAMDFFLVSDICELSIGKFSINEPKNAQNAVLPSDFNSPICIVPGILFDRNGYRIGFGKGYYDRYFVDRENDILLIGVCPDYMLCSEIPHSEHDLKTDILVSEKEVLRFER